jgi:predicted SprT family Zn-dependent metalloprotease
MVFSSWFRILNVCIVQYNTFVKFRSKPTEQSYAELQAAYDWFNNELFGGQLPPCLITLQRNKRTMGYFSQDRFVNLEGSKTDEIALNPEFFGIQTVEQVLSTLVHEMVHLWQQHFGAPGRGKYHNQEWADKMREIGLPASHTGAPGGRQTGDHMDHYILEGGPFLRSCESLLKTSFKISWYDYYPAMAVSNPSSGIFDDRGTAVEAADAAASQAIPALVSPTILAAVATDNASNRQKFKCRKCGAQAWGKSSLNLICGDCSLPMPRSN